MGGLIYALIKYFELQGLKPNTKHLMQFGTYLEDQTSWEKRSIDNSSVYFYTKDENYQIEIPDDYDINHGNSLGWSQVFPDTLAYSYVVNLKHGGSTIKQVRFINCDGGRYFLAKSDQEATDGKLEYYWDSSAIQYKVGMIISRFDLYPSLEHVAGLCSITIK